MDDLSNPIRGEKDVTRSPAAPNDNWVTLRTGMPLVNKTTKGGIFVVANFTLKEWKEIWWCRGLRCGSDDNFAKWPGVGCKNGKLLS